MKLEMALALGAGGDSGKHDKACGKAAGKHGSILSARTTLSYVVARE